MPCSITVTQSSNLTAFRAAYSAGFDPGIGFLHEMAPGSAPLVYDLQEPFRWMVDITIIEALERKAFGKKDFMLTENYNLRIRPEGVRKLIGLLDARFTSKTPYKDKHWEWGYVIASKTGELARFLEGNGKAIDFALPLPNLKRDDSEVVRSRIRDLTYAEWKESGFSKGTLHELKKKARSEEPFKVYGKVRERLAASNAT